MRQEQLMANDGKSLEKRKTALVWEKRRRDCIHPVVEPNGQFNYTVAAGSDVC